MAYEYIPKGQKLHPRCKTCGKEIVVDVDSAKSRDTMIIVCDNCKNENKLDTRKLLEDLDKQIRAQLQKTFGKSFLK